MMELPGGGVALSLMVLPGGHDDPCGRPAQALSHQQERWVTSTTKKTFKHLAEVREDAVKGSHVFCKSHSLPENSPTKKCHFGHQRRHYGGGNAEFASAAKRASGK